MLRIADSARVDGGVPPFTRTEFCQEKKRGVAAKCAGPAAKCAGPTTKCAGPAAKCAGPTTKCADPTTKCAGPTAKCAAQRPSVLPSGQVRHRCRRVCHRPCAPRRPTVRPPKRSRLLSCPIANPRSTPDSKEADSTRAPARFTLALPRSLRSHSCAQLLNSTSHDGEHAREFVCCPAYARALAGLALLGTLDTCACRLHPRTPHADPSQASRITPARHSLCSRSALALHVRRRTSARAQGRGHLDSIGQSSASRVCCTR